MASRHNIWQLRRIRSWRPKEKYRHTKKPVKGWVDLRSPKLSSHPSIHNVYTQYVRLYSVAVRNTDRLVTSTNRETRITELSMQHWSLFQHENTAMLNLLRLHWTFVILAISLQLSIKWKQKRNSRHNLWYVFSERKDQEDWKTS